jgi:hypothetical protein
MVTQLLSAVAASVLTTRAADLSGRAGEITRAMDMLLQGF